MAAAGELEVLPGIVTPVSLFLQSFQKSIEGEYVVLAAADRFRKTEVLQAFFEAGFSWDNLSFRGTGASALADGSHDVRSFQRRCATKGFKPASGLLNAVEYAISESWVRYDGGGNPALDK